jgi:predicted DNA-binding WGR domain protein
MPSTLVIGSDYLVHSGGTKFYEIVTFSNASEKTFVEVRRWGKIELAQSGGGQTQVLAHPTAADALDSARKQVRAKERGDYDKKPGKFGLHVANGTQTLGAAYRAIGEHYADPELVASVRLKTGSARDGAALEPAIDDLPKEPMPEPDRGESWGSW